MDRYILTKMNDNLNRVCFLCSESTADQCHRRLVAEYIKATIGDESIKIVHL